MSDENNNRCPHGVAIMYYGCQECAQASELAAPPCSAAGFALPNDTKIRVCNVMNALRRHGANCMACATYIVSGDGDLCARGKDIIAMELAYADTGLVLPPNAKLSGAED